jgi:tetratricopeptide (TPR) repeat protein
MRANVFTDGSLGRFAGRFVWLAIDAEKGQNASVRKNLRLEAFPTLAVVDPATGGAIVRWIGAPTVPQLARFLDDSSKRFASRSAKKGKSTVAGGARAADDALARADRLAAEGSYAEAVTAFDEALASAPASWPAFGRAVEALLYALDQTNQPERGARLAEAALPKVGRAPAAAGIATSGLGAALALPPTVPERAEWLERFDQVCREIAADPRFPISGDDRSGILQLLVTARKELGPPEAVCAAAREWSAFLEEAAAAARTPEERAVFDSHRLSAFLELGEPERAVAFLQAAEKELPEDYNPSARLAIALKAAERLDEALAANGRALEKVYGPRRLVILDTRVEIFLARGNRSEARKVLEEAVGFADALPEGQRSEGKIRQLRKRMAELADPESASPNKGG